MTSSENITKAKKILKEHHITETEQYILISNYGLTFKHKDIKFDARFWENCYGFISNIWSVNPYGAEFDCASNDKRADARRFAKELEIELNK